MQAWSLAEDRYCESPICRVKKIAGRDPTLHERPEKRLFPGRQG
jgi:hypothetical protein